MKTNKMKMMMIGLVSASVLSSCSSYYTIKPIGELTSASTRNIDHSVEYKQIKSYAGISRTDVEAAKSAARKGKIKKGNPIIKEVNAYKAKQLNEAIDNVVKSVAGGEYIQNVRVYQVNYITPFGGISTDYVISGDVWGANAENAEIKGFHKNDKVVFTFTNDLKKIIGKKNFDGEIGKQYNGKIIELKGGSATVQLENATVLDIPYSNLTNLGQE